MPCWTTSTTTVDLDASGVDLARMIRAGEKHGIIVSRQNGRIILRDPQGRPVAEMARLVKQTYSGLTVEAAMQRFGYKIQTKTSENVEGVGRVVSLRVGR